MPDANDERTPDGPERNSGPAPRVARGVRRGRQRRPARYRGAVSRGVPEPRHLALLRWLHAAGVGQLRWAQDPGGAGMSAPQDSDYPRLPPAHRTGLDECLATAWRNLDQN